MARHWRRLALAASVAAALGMCCACAVEAQAPTKSGSKAKAKAKAAKEEEGEDASAAKPKKKARQDPAQAQKTIEAAVKLLEAGKATEATHMLSAVLSGGNLPPAIMAKALLYRGIAYRQQKMPAQAIADLTSALWLKGGLAQSDRTDALHQRASAYQEAGLTEGGGAITPAVPSTARAQTRTASAASGWAAATSSSGPSSGLAPSSQDEAAPKQSSSGWSLGNPFAGLFGGSSTPAPSPPPSPPTTASIEPPGRANASGAQHPRTSAWSRNTEVHGGSGAAAASAPARPEGRFRIQLGMVRTQDEAQSLAAKVKREHGPALASREPEVDQAVVGNMGSFYRVRVGPFATQQEGQAACAKLKGSGLDCLVVTQ